MQIAIKFVKCCLLLLIGISIAILWVYCHGFLPHEFYGTKPINPAAERFGGMVTLAILFVAPALPIYRLFPKRVIMASAVVGWIPLALSVMFAYQTNFTVDSTLLLSLAVLEGILCWLVIILGTWSIKTILKPSL